MYMVYGIWCFFAIFSLNTLDGSKIVWFKVRPLGRWMPKIKLIEDDLLSKLHMIIFFNLLYLLQSLPMTTEKKNRRRIVGIEQWSAKLWDWKSQILQNFRSDSREETNCLSKNKNVWNLYEIYQLLSSADSISKSHMRLASPTLVLAGIEQLPNDSRTSDEPAINAS